MIRRADLVFVTSEKLRARAAQCTRSRCTSFPSASASPRSTRSRQSPRQPPDDIATLSRPLAGYVGGMHQWVDQDLIVEVARKLPHVTFVFIGPAQCDVSRLEACPNVVLLGARPHAELPQYIREFDAGLVPYRLSEYTTNVYPTKLNEYLAMGIPVVATDLAEIQRFNEDHGQIVVDRARRGQLCRRHHLGDRAVHVRRGRAPRRGRAIERVADAHPPDGRTDRDRRNSQGSGRGAVGRAAPAHVSRGPSAHALCWASRSSSPTS